MKSSGLGTHVGLSHWCGCSVRSDDKVKAARPRRGWACTLPIACCPAICTPHAPSLKSHAASVWVRAEQRREPHWQRGSGVPPSMSGAVFNAAKIRQRSSELLRDVRSLRKLRGGTGRRPIRLTGHSSPEQTGARAGSTLLHAAALHGIGYGATVAEASAAGEPVMTWHKTTTRHQPVLLRRIAAREGSVS